MVVWLKRYSVIETFRKLIQWNLKACLMISFTKSMCENSQALKPILCSLNSNHQYLYQLGTIIVQSNVSEYDSYFPLMMRFCLCLGQCLRFYDLAQRPPLPVILNVVHIQCQLQFALIQIPMNRWPQNFPHSIWIVMKKILSQMVPGWSCIAK